MEQQENYSDITQEGLQRLIVRALKKCAEKENIDVRNEKSGYVIVLTCYKTNISETSDIDKMFSIKQVTLKEYTEQEKSTSIDIDIWKIETSDHFYGVCMWICEYTFYEILVRGVEIRNKITIRKPGVDFPKTIVYRGDKEYYYEEL